VYCGAVAVGQAQVCQRDGGLASRWLRLLHRRHQAASAQATDSHSARSTAAAATRRGPAPHINRLGRGAVAAGRAAVGRVANTATENLKKQFVNENSFPLS
jgi:hypothetical protein